MDAETLELLTVQNVAKAEALQHVLFAVITVLSPEQRRDVVNRLRRAADATVARQDTLGAAATAMFDETYANFFALLAD